MSDTCGLIIVGNSGVGKSFLANIILNKHYFKHDFSARSVTHRTESVIYMLNDRYFTIYNIPGLIEGDEERMAVNKREITRAFEEQKGNPLIVIYVFGHQNGRIRNEDIVTFRTIYNAYPFYSDSLITIVNGLPPHRPRTYNEDTQATLIDLLGIIPSQFCFIDQLNLIDKFDVKVRQQLIDAIVDVRPQIHSKAGDINLTTEDVHQLTADLDMIRIQMNIEQQEHEDTIQRMEQEYEANKRLSALRRLFYEAKVDLRRLLSLSEYKKQLKSTIEHWEEEKIDYEDNPKSHLYRQVIKTKQIAEEHLSTNRTKQRYIEASLNVHRCDIEQTCFELDQIYNTNFDRKYESVREYYILLDDLRFDDSISKVKHNFVNDLCTFTSRRFGNIE